MIITDVLGKNFNLKPAVKKINGVPVEIKSFVDVSDFANIVRTVAESCVADGEFRAENREIARRFAILKYMTDIEVSADNVNEIFKTTQGGTWWGEIEREVTKLPIWAEVEAAIDAQIAARPTAFDKLCSDLSAIISTDNAQNLADIKEVLAGLEKVDKRAFVEAVTENVIDKTRDSDA